MISTSSIISTPSRKMVKIFSQIANCCLAAASSIDVISPADMPSRRPRPNKLRTLDNEKIDSDLDFSFFSNDKLNYSYAGLGRLDVQHAQTNIGDLAAEVGWYAADDAHRSVSLWGGLEAPTGSVAGLTSDGAWDAALWAHGAWRWAHWQLAGELGVTQPFGDELFAGSAHRTAAFGRAALTRSLGSAWSLRAQLDGQTGHVDDSDSRFLGRSLQFSLGLVRRLKGRWHLDFGFVEDAAVNTAPDITFFLGIRN